MSKIAGIIFDMDGTLVNSSKVIFEGYQFALAPWGIALNKQQIESIRAKKGETLFEDWGLSVQESLEAVGRMNRYCQEEALRSELFPGIATMLSELYRKQIPMAIWTGRNTEAAKNLLEKQQIIHFFSPIIGSSCVEQNKPHPEGIIRIAKQWGLSIQSLLMIGDHDHDIEAGAAAGCLTARAAWRERNPTHHQHATSDWLLEKPEQLLTLL